MNFLKNMIKIKMTNNTQNKLPQTVEAKIEDTSLYLILEDIGKLYCYIQKKLYNELFNEKIINDKLRGKIRPEYLAKYKISRRFFDSIWTEVTALVTKTRGDYKKYKEKTYKKIEITKEKILKKEKYINKNKIKLEKEKKLADNYRAIFQMKQKIDRLNQKIKYSKPAKVIFGTKDLYKQQWTNEGYIKDHILWLEEWRRKRNSRFSFVGSHDESSGNQMCQYIVDKTGEYLQVRLPYALEEKYGKYIKIPVKFHSDRTNKKYYINFQQAVINHTALSYKFLKKENGFWYIECSFNLEKEISNNLNNYNGAIGIDINYGLIASTEVDRNGNFLKVKNYDCDPEVLSSSQMEDLISRQLDEIVKQAKDTHKCIVAEDLDLSDKKLEMRDPITNRKISMLPYNIIWLFLISKCFKAGVLLLGVPPYWTSQMGKFKYEKMYGISRHNAAAMCIARRGLGYKEKFPEFYASILRSGEESKRKSKAKPAKAAPKFQSYGYRQNWTQWRNFIKNLDKCFKVLEKATEDPGGCSAPTRKGKRMTAEDILTSRFNPSYLSFIRR
jgi:IS605 OrfB family transposase